MKRAKMMPVSEIGSGDHVEYPPQSGRWMRVGSWEHVIPYVIAMDLYDPHRYVRVEYRPQDTVKVRKREGRRRNA